MTYIFIIVLSFISTSCGAQDWINDKTEEAEEEVGEIQDEWIYERALDVAESYYGLLYRALTTERYFSINPERCLSDTLCQDLADSERIRQTLSNIMIEQYNIIPKHKTLLPICEGYRYNSVIMRSHSKELDKLLISIQNRVNNKTMSDILQFGNQYDSITEYVIKNTSMLVVLKAELSKTDYLLTYIYPSEKYIPILSERKNTIKPR
jgi:chlorite dismutase